MEDLITTIENVSLTSREPAGSAKNNGGTLMKPPQVGGRFRPELNDIKKQLEEDFLRPSPSFSAEWLNKLQG
jgi:hypothetical protein